MQRRSGAVANLAFCVLIFGGVAVATSTFPNPTREPTRCGRPSTVEKSWVCDPDQFLSTEAQNSIETAIHNTVSNVPSPCGPGYQMAVVVVRSFREHGHDNAKSLAQALHSEWGVGSKGCSDGIVVVFAVNDRQVFISTGADVKVRLSNRRILKIIDSSKPALRRGDYDVATMTVVDGIWDILNGDDDGWSVEDALFTVVGGFACVMVVISWWRGGSNRRREAEECRRRLQQVQHDAEASRASRFRFPSCPICLEKFDDMSQNETSTGGIAEQRDHEENDQSGHKTTPQLKSGLSLAHGPGDDDIVDADGDRANERTTLRCGHSFCRPCISQWFATHMQCPVCRDTGENENELAERERQELHRQYGSDGDSAPVGGAGVDGAGGYRSGSGGGGAAGTTRYRPSSSQTTSASAAATMAAHVLHQAPRSYYSDLRFRLMRVHDDYPFDVPLDMVNRLSNRHTPWHGSFTSTQAYGHSADTSLSDGGIGAGSYGSRMDFGGGSFDSDSGGGAGSSW